MLQQVSNLPFPQQSIPFSLISGYSLDLTRWFLKLYPECNETNGTVVKTLLICSFKLVIYNFLWVLLFHKTTFSSFQDIFGKLMGMNKSL